MAEALRPYTVEATQNPILLLSAPRAVPFFCREFRMPQHSDPATGIHSLATPDSGPGFADNHPQGARLARLRDAEAELARTTALLEQLASPLTLQSTNANHQTPLDQAVADNQIELVRFLAPRMGLAVFSRNGKNALGRAVMFGDERFECVAAILAASPDPAELLIPQQGDYNWPPLIEAAINAPRILALLLPWADPRQTHSDMHVAGVTPLMMAAEAGQLESVKALLPLSDVNAQSTDGQSALSRAAKNTHAPCVAELLSAPGIDTENVLREKTIEWNRPRKSPQAYWRLPLREAMSAEGQGCMRLLAPRSPVSTPCGADGRTPLEVAARAASLEWLKILAPLLNMGAGAQGLAGRRSFAAAFELARRSSEQTFRVNQEFCDAVDFMGVHAMAMGAYGEVAPARHKAVQDDPGDSTWANLPRTRSLHEARLLSAALSKVGAGGAKLSKRAAPRM